MESVYAEERHATIFDVEVENEVIDVVDGQFACERMRRPLYDNFVIILKRMWARMGDRRDSELIEGSCRVSCPSKSR